MINLLTHPFSCLSGMTFMLYSSNLSFNLPISLQLYLIWYLTFPRSYTFEMDLHLLLVFSAYFFMGFVFLNCDFIFSWKPIWGFFETCSDSEFFHEDLCLLSQSIIGTIYRGPSGFKCSACGGLDHANSMARIWLHIY